MATLAILYSVAPEAFTEAVYPVDQAQPLKNVTETHTEVTVVPVMTTTDTIEDTTVSIPTSISTVT